MGFGPAPGVGGTAGGASPLLSSGAGGWPDGACALGGAAEGEGAAGVMPLSSCGGGGAPAAVGATGCGAAAPLFAAPAAEGWAEGAGAVSPLLSSGDAPPAGGEDGAAGGAAFGGAAGCAGVAALLPAPTAPDWSGAAAGIMPLSSLGAAKGGWLL